MFKYLSAVCEKVTKQILSLCKPEIIIYFYLFINYYYVLEH